MALLESFGMYKWDIKCGECIGINALRNLERKGKREGKRREEKRREEKRREEKRREEKRREDRLITILLISLLQLTRKHGPAFIYYP
jgi:hypothetical protein